MKKELTINAPILNIKELASNIIGDGKRPNKWFVTIGYGTYFEKGQQDDMKTIENSLECVTILFTEKFQAMQFLKSFPLDADIEKVTTTTISHLVLEDRITGVCAERFIFEKNNGSFGVLDCY